MAFALHLTEMESAIYKFHYKVWHLHQLEKRLRLDGASLNDF